MDRHGNSIPTQSAELNSQVLVHCGETIYGCHDNCIRSHVSRLYVYGISIISTWFTHNQDASGESGNERVFVFTCRGRCSTGVGWRQWSAARPERCGPGRRSLRRSSSDGSVLWHQTASPALTPAGQQTPARRWSSWFWFSCRRNKKHMFISSFLWILLKVIV